MHSATKYLGGHSDLLLGTVIASTPELAHQLRERSTLTGSTPGTLEAFLAVRGMRTLPLRLERATATAADLADRHHAVELVRYPGFGAVVSSTWRAAPRVRTRCAARCASSDTPPPSAAWSRPWSAGRPSPARPIYRLPSSGSASGASTPPTCGAT